MATTWMKALHKSGGSIAAALGRSTEYIENPDKTDGGELIDAYECDARTVQSEFLLSKRLYEQKTGRDQGKHGVIAYHVRMSFKPGEVTAQQALELGRELGLRWTKGRHQFIVAAHTNTKNPHAHIIFNSVNLDCTGKFEDFKRSAIALRRVSDQICLENGLSVIEKPGLSKGFNRAEYLGVEKAPTVRDRLRDLIDAALRDSKSFEEFIAAIKSAGCEVKQGKHLAIKIPGGERFIRCKSLGDDYTEDAIIERILGKRIVAPKQKNIAPPASSKPNLLIDIQAKIQQGKGAGYEQWARVFNLKEAAKTLIFLQERGLTDYDVLSETAQAASKHFGEVGSQLKVIEARLKEISELQKHIGAYSKTLEVYRGYRDSKWSKKYYAQHEADIISHKAAKKYFDGIGLKKLPTMQTLKTEYAALAAEKRKLHQGYRPAREEMIALLMAKQNTERILDMTPPPKKSHEKSGQEL
ncbi:relaxase/mobilization nuclease domain-containing protein [Ruminococcaceae bacterium OttesenSCG-928-L11]|nr:relaxase/mobilization nuclease domain-containing protein [Ruminococcaceae bacterium OttesenSCG-928-L11]